MQIKSFKAPTLKEAMANVKSELGVDAVILHTNKIKKGGILGFHAKEIVEVIAAIEDESVVKEQKPAMDTGAASEAVLQAAAAARASRNSAPEPQPTGNFMPRNMVSQYQTAGTIEAISHAMAQNTPSPTFGEVLASVNKAQEQVESGESASGTLPQQLSDQPVVNEQVVPVQPAVDVNSGVEQPVVKEELAEPMQAAPESLSQDRDTVTASEDATDLDSCSVEDLADFVAAKRMAYLKYQIEIRKDSLEKTETRSFHNFVTDFMSSGRGDLEEGIRFINFYFSKITTERNTPRLKLNIEITKKCWNSSYYLQECCVYFSGKKLRFNAEEIRLSDMKTALSTVITKEQLGQMANSTDVVVRLMNTTDYVDAKLSAQNISFLKQFYEEEILGNKPNETLQQK